jgi:hypothetical protein
VGSIGRGITKEEEMVSPKFISIQLEKVQKGTNAERDKKKTTDAATVRT